MELLAVIAMVGVIAAASAPSVIFLLRDRRVNDVGAEIANLYRYARARAMGRGSAVNVRYNNAPTALSALDPADPDARFAAREALVVGLAAGEATGFAQDDVGAQQNLGLPRCKGTGWGAGNANTLYLGSADDRRARFYPAEASFIWTDETTVAATVDICFTPRGRVWVSRGGAAFVALTGVPYILLQNQVEAHATNPNLQSLMRRKVIIPPTGAARLITEIN